MNCLYILHKNVSRNPSLELSRQDGSNEGYSISFMEKYEKLSLNFPRQSYLLFSKQTKYTMFVFIGEILCILEWNLNSQHGNLRHLESIGLYKRSALESLNIWTLDRVQAYNICPNGPPYTWPQYMSNILV